MYRTDSVIAIYEKHEQAEQAVQDLDLAGFDLQNLSIAAKGTDAEEEVVGFYNTSDRMLYWAKRGAFWGAIWGFIFDTALFAIPGVGPVLLAGPLVSWIVAVLEGAIVVGGISALGAGLVSIGIPTSSVIPMKRL